MVALGRGGGSENGRSTIRSLWSLLAYNKVSFGVGAVARTVKASERWEELPPPVVVVKCDALHLHFAGRPDHEVGPLVAEDPAQALYLV